MTRSQETSTYTVRVTLGGKVAEFETDATSREQAIRNIRRQMKDDGVKGVTSYAARKTVQP